MDRLGLPSAVEIGFQDHGQSDRDSERWAGSVQSEPRRPFQDLGQSHYLSEGLRFRTRDSAGTIPSQRQLPCCMSNAWQPPPPPTGTIACGLPAASPHKPAVCCPLPVLTQTPWDEDLGDPLCGTTQRLPSPEAGTPKAAASSSRYS